MVSIDLVVVNYHTYPLIQKFIDSYYENLPATPSRLILIDNESNPAELAKLNLRGTIVIPSVENLGYARACNLGASIGTSKYLALLNSDTQFINNCCVDRLVEFMEENPKVGVTGPFQYSTAYGRPRVTHAGIFGSGDRPRHRGWRDYNLNYKDVKEALMISGSAMFIRREAWDKIHQDPIFKKHWPNALGAMPEHDLYYEDTAVCYAMPHFGYEVWYVGDQGAEMIHQWAQTAKPGTNGDKMKSSKLLFQSLLDDWGILHD